MRAHNIKNGEGGRAKAIFALKSTYKWALSGTPIQNRSSWGVTITDAVSYSFFFCDKCDCKSLDYEFSEGQMHMCESGHKKFQSSVGGTSLLQTLSRQADFEIVNKGHFNIINKILAKTLFAEPKGDKRILFFHQEQSFEDPAGAFAHLSILIF